MSKKKELLQTIKKLAASLCAQLGVALASVAALVKKRNIFHAALLVGIAGVAVTAYAFGNHYLGW